MTMTAALDTFRERAVAMLRSDPRIEAVLEAGAGASGVADNFSDLDLILVATDEAYANLLEDRLILACGLGHLLSAFTGEHVGEPRLLICLYAIDEGDQLLHVDLKVIKRAALAHRVDDPVVLFDNAGGCGSIVVEAPAVWPERSAQWFEDRMWIWVHYGAAKAARGEVFEAINTLNFLREQILGPVVATAAGKPQRGLRRIERVPGAADALRKTLAGADPAGLRDAFVNCIDLYVSCRAHNPPEIERGNAEQAVRLYLDAVLSKALAPP